MSQVVYKLRHKPTGMFYQPVKGRWSRDKTHLSTRGKIYETKQYPSMENIGTVYISEAQVRKLELDYVEKSQWGNRLLYKPDDWEIVEYYLTEKVD